MPLPELPPAFELRVAPDGSHPFDLALAGVEREVVDGLVFWSGDPGRFTMAVVLEPEAGARQAEEAAEVCDVFRLALLAAIGALIPPAIPVEIRGSGQILVDGSELGAVRAMVEPGGTPGWVVVGTAFQLASGGASVSLEQLVGEAPAGDVLLGSLCRHLLAWIYRWQDDGIATVREHLAAFSTGPRT